MLYAFGVFWGFVLLASFLGWGLAVRSVLGLDRAGSRDPGQAVPFGIATLIAVGGVVNLSHAMSPALAIAIVAAGLVLAAWTLRPRGFQADAAGPPDATTGLNPWDGLMGVLALGAYATYVCYGTPPEAGAAFDSYALHVNDDLGGGYVVYPLRMLQQGDIGDDAFNDRRSSSALGGLSFLQSLVLAVLPPTYIHLIDPGIVILALPLLFMSMRRGLGASPWLPCLLMVLFLCLPTYAANASAICLPVLLLLSLWRQIAAEEAPPGLRGVLGDALALALPCSALVTLKHTTIPGTCAAAALTVLLRMVSRDPRRVVGELLRGLLAAGLTVALLAPWMAASWRASGTLLYPVLGEGFRNFGTLDIPHRSSHRTPEGVVRELLQIVFNLRVLAGVALAALATSALLRGRAPRRHVEAFAAVTGGTVLTLLVFGKMFYAAEFMRYAYIYVTMLIVLPAAALLGEPASRAWLARVHRWAIPVLLAFLLSVVVYGGVKQRRFVPPALASIHAAITQGRGPTVDPEKARYYQRIQEVVPPGRRILAYTPDPYLLNFARNPINIIDSPGGISPPPGMPFSAPPDSFASYLRSQGIDYLITTTMPPEKIEAMQGQADSLRGKNDWIASLMARTRDLEIQVRALLSYCKILYHDGDLYVISLNEVAPRSNTSPTLGLIPSSRDNGRD